MALPVCPTSAITSPWSTKVPLANPVLAVVGVDGDVEVAVTDDHHVPVVSQTFPAVDHPPRLGGADQGTRLRGEVDALVKPSLAGFEAPREASPERPGEGEIRVLDRVVTRPLAGIAADSPAGEAGRMGAGCRRAPGIHSRSPICERPLVPDPVRLQDRAHGHLVVPGDPEDVLAPADGVEDTVPFAGRRWAQPSSRTARTAAAASAARIRRFPRRPIRAHPPGPRSGSARAARARIRRRAVA